MTEAEFWNGTPREFDARAALLKREDRMLANILSALHNGAMIRKDERAWTAEMFMPDYEVPKPGTPTAEAGTLQYHALKAGFSANRKPTQESQESQDMQRQIAFRMQRAREAQTNGATGEQIASIMRGVL
jgi:hypothetical protein